MKNKFVPFSSLFLETADYFVTALVCSDDAYHRRPKKFKQMISKIDEVLADENASEATRELATKLSARKQEIIKNGELHARLDEG